MAYNDLSNLPGARRSAAVVTRYASDKFIKRQKEAQKKLEEVRDKREREKKNRRRSSKKDDNQTGGRNLHSTKSDASRSRYPYPKDPLEPVRAKSNRRTYLQTSNKTSPRPNTTTYERNNATRELALKTIRNKIQSDNPNIIAPKFTKLRGDELDAVKRKLNISPHSIPAVMREKVKAYQRKHGLKVDGIVGEQTLNAMGIRSHSLPK